jgi:hypothetical protein
MNQTEQEFEKETTTYEEIEVDLNECIETFPCLHKVQILTKSRVDGSIIARLEKKMFATDIISQLKENNQEIPTHFNDFLE